MAFFVQSSINMVEMIKSSPKDEISPKQQKKKKSEGKKPVVEVPQKFAESSQGAQAILLLKKSAAALSESNGRLEVRCQELEKKLHENTAETAVAAKKVEKLSKQSEEINKEIRDKEDQFKKMEDELEKIDATLAAVAAGEGERDVKMSTDEKQKLTEKREMLHSKLTNKQAKEDLFAKKKEVFELPVGKSELQGEVRKLQSKGHAIGAERDAEMKLLAERKELYSSVLALLKKMGSPYDERANKSKVVAAKVKEGGSDTKQEGGDSGTSPVRGEGNAKLKHKHSIIGSIKRIFKRGSATKNKC